MINQIKISLKNKLMLAIIIVAFITTFISFIFMFYIELNSKWQNKIDSSILNTKLIAEYVVTPVIFDDKEGVQENLMKFKTISSLLKCFIFDSNKTIYSSANYNENNIKLTFNADVLKVQSYPNYQVIGNETHLINEITFKNHKYGYVYLIVSNRDINEGIKNYILIMLTLLIGSIILSFFIANQIQKTITKPIINLSDNMAIIAKSANYSQIFSHNFKDEIGDLYSGFNILLNQIELRKLERENVEFSLKQSEERYKNLVELSPIPIFVIKDLKFIYLNTAAYILFGFENPIEIINKSILDYLSLNDPNQSLSIVFNPNSYDETINFIIQKSDTSFAEIEAKSQLINYLGSDAVMIICSDVTDRKAAERKITNLNYELEKRVISRTEQLQHTLQELNNEIVVRKKAEQKLQESQYEIIEAFEREKELSELKSRLVSMVSHEYRNPMSVIKSSTDMLIHFFQNNNQEKFSRHVDKIQKSVNHMMSLLEDVLDYNRLGKIQKLNISSINVIDLTKEVIEEMSIIDTENVRIKTEFLAETLTIKTDEKLLRQILTNLITNALKYSSKNENILVKIYKEVESLTIDIIDYGIGIPSDDIHLIFDPFHRAKNTGLIQGTGFGLSIVKKSVELLGGKIYIDSKLNQGSKFTVKLYN